VVCKQLGSNGHERLEKRKRYRWAYVGSLLTGIVAMFVAMRLGYPLVGIGLYWAGVLGMGVVFWCSPVELFDERDRSLERRAAALTLNVMAVVGVATIPGAVFLEKAGYLTITPTMTGMALGYLAFYAVGAAVYAVVWLRQ
jgi:peptidoglycan biosynthesis protein MviN/MurJ (putative lipid II flippase)